MTFYKMKIYSYRSRRVILYYHRTKLSFIIIVLKGNELIMHFIEEKNLREMEQNKNNYFAPNNRKFNLNSTVL
jgi:hypothetical protein